MEILMISESKLKVMLTSDDLVQFSLSADTLDYGNTETRRMFWDILGRAKQSVGFDTEGHRVLVQLYPSRDGGCEMFISRLGSICRASNEKEGQEDAIAIIAQESADKNRTKKAPVPKEISVFGFDTMERMLAVCRRLCDMAYEGESEAYLSDDGRCYLFLSDVECSEYLPFDEYSFIREYGTPESEKLLRPLVGEHARVICPENAVGCLAQF